MASSTTCSFTLSPTTKRRTPRPWKRMTATFEAINLGKFECFSKLSADVETIMLVSCLHTVCEYTHNICTICVGGGRCCREWKACGGGNGAAHSSVLKLFRKVELRLYNWAAVGCQMNYRQEPGRSLVSLSKLLTLVSLFQAHCQWITVCQCSLHFFLRLSITMLPINRVCGVFQQAGLE